MAHAETAGAGAEPLWSEGLGLGIPELDADDRRLIALVRELNEVIDSGRDATGMRRLMQRVLDAAIDHFEREERVLLQTSYPLRRGHAALHRQMKSELEYAMEQFERDEMRSAWPAFGLLVEQLFFEHLRQETASYRKYVRLGLAHPPS